MSKLFQSNALPASFHSARPTPEGQLLQSGRNSTDHFKVKLLLTEVGKESLDRFVASDPSITLSVKQVDNSPVPMVLREPWEKYTDDEYHLSGNNGRKFYNEYYGQTDQLLFLDLGIDHCHYDLYFGMATEEDLSDYYVRQAAASKSEMSLSSDDSTDNSSDKKEIDFGVTSMSALSPEQISELIASTECVSGEDHDFSTPIVEPITPEQISELIAGDYVTCPATFESFTPEQISEKIISSIEAKLDQLIESIKGPVPESELEKMVRDLNS